MEERFDMSATPVRPGTEDEIDEETRAILDERMKTIDEDAKNAVDAKTVIAEGRRRLQQMRPH